MESRQLLSSTLLGVFGTVNGHNEKLVHTLGDGTKETFSLTVGTGTLSQDQSGNLSISTTGTTLSSTMSVALAGTTKIATLAGITTDAALGTLSFSKVNLVGGPLTIGGSCKTVQLNNATNSTMTFGGTTPISLSVGTANDCVMVSTAPFSSLYALTFTGTAGVVGFPNGGVGSITAPWIGSLKTKSYIQTDLNLSGVGAPGGMTLKTAQFGVGIDTCKWKITGNVGSILATNSIDGFNGSISGSIKSLVVDNTIGGSKIGAASFGTILVKNSITTNSRILAGAGFGPDGVLGGGDDTFAAGTIGSLTVQNSITNSLVAAGLNAADDAFPINSRLTGNDSLIAGGSIKSVTVNTAISADSQVLAAELPAKVKLHFKSVSPVGNRQFML